MQSEVEKISETKVKLVIVSGEEDLKSHKQAVLARLSNEVKLDGFRKGKAPAHLVEKYVDQNVLQREFLDAAMSALYSDAANAQKVRPVGQPEVEVKKFVPFSALDFDITVEVVGNVKLRDYKNIKQAKDPVSVTAKDIEGVLKSLQTRMAERKDVTRAAKSGDEALIDFKGVDDKNDAVKGAEGKDYPLLIGSNSFIPGFEDNVIGMKPADEKSFTLTFPKDYGVKAIANKKITFTVQVKKVSELEDTKLSDEFAAKVGPFKTFKELKDDIKKQLTEEKQQQINKDFQNKLVEGIVNKSSVAIPDSMVAHQLEHNLQEAKKNMTYRGLTYQEFLEQEGLTDKSYVDTVLKPQAEKQIKTSVVLSEISQKEGISITPEELEVRLQILKGQYKSDPQMQTELDKPEGRQDIANRMVIEKVLALLESSTA